MVIQETQNTYSPAPTAVMRLPRGGMCHWGIIENCRNIFWSEDYIFLLGKVIL